MTKRKLDIIGIYTAEDEAKAEEEERKEGRSRK
jgi:hypothetical protein